MERETPNVWWVVALCAVVAPTALGLATFWGRIIAQQMRPPPTSVYEDPFMVPVTGPVFLISCVGAPLLLFALLVTRKQFRTVVMRWQVAVASLLLACALYCLGSYVVRTEQVARSMTRNSTLPAPR